MDSLTFCSLYEDAQQLVLELCSDNTKKILGLTSTYFNTKIAPENIYFQANDLAYDNCPRLSKFMNPDILDNIDDYILGNLGVYDQNWYHLATDLSIDLIWQGAVDGCHLSTIEEILFYYEDIILEELYSYESIVANDRLDILEVLNNYSVYWNKDLILDSGKLSTVSYLLNHGYIINLKEWSKLFKENKWSYIKLALDYDSGSKKSCFNGNVLKFMFKGLYGALKYGNIYLAKKLIDFYPEVLAYILSENLSHRIFKYCLWEVNDKNIAAIFDYLRLNGFVINKKTAQCFGAYGSKNTIAWLKKEVGSVYDHDVTKAAVLDGNYQLMENLFEIGMSWHPKIWTYVVRVKYYDEFYTLTRYSGYSNNMDLYDNFVSDEKMINGLAREGDYDFFYWVRFNDIRRHLTEELFINAVMGQNIDLIEFLGDVNCPSNAQAVADALFDMPVSKELPALAAFLGEMFNFADEFVEIFRLDD